MGNIILELKNVSKKYGRKKIIDGLSLKVESGQIYGFLGPNGAGKTTTIKMIVGLISTDNGEILINGLNVQKEFEKAMQNVGAIVEGPDLYEYLTGIQNINIYAGVHNVDKNRIQKIIELVGLRERINDKVKKYSLGMKQRLGIAISILHNPKLLILDEPTNGLDPEGIKDLRDLIKDLAHKGNVAVFISSHMLSEMQLMCDKVAIIDKGKIIKLEDLQNLKSSDKNIYEFKVSNLDKAFEIISKITTCSIVKNCLMVNYNNQISDILKLLIKNDIEIINFSKKESTLE